MKKILAQSNAFSNLIKQQSAISKLLSQSWIPKIPIFNIPKIVLPDFSRQFRILNESFFSVFEQQSKLWENFAVQYKKVSKKSLINLKKYNWFINASMPASFIAETAKAKNSKEMKELFISYHLYENCNTLDAYYLNWSKKALFKKRLKILRDTINLFKENYKNRNININSIIIPVLINQIEGIKHDYMKSKGFQNISPTQYRNPNTNQNVSWKDVFNDALQNQDDFTKLIGSIFEKILFQKETDKAPIINFSRHKISHGAIVRYGTIETTVRCFMILEFLSEMN